MRVLAYDLKHGVTPCWRGKSTTEWTWEGASSDPASRKWPKPEDCIKLNFVEVYASNLIDAKIKEVLNPSGWANRNGPSRDPTAEPNLEQIATWKIFMLSMTPGFTWPAAKCLEKLLLSQGTLPTPSNHGVVLKLTG